MQAERVQLQMQPLKPPGEPIQPAPLRATLRRQQQHEQQQQQQQQQQQRRRRRQAAGVVEQRQQVMRELSEASLAAGAKPLC